MPWKEEETTKGDVRGRMAFKLVTVTRVVSRIQTNTVLGICRPAYQPFLFLF